MLRTTNLAEWDRPGHKSPSAANNKESRTQESISTSNNASSYLIEKIIPIRNREMLIRRDQSNPNLRSERCHGRSGGY